MLGLPRYYSYTYPTFTELPPGWPHPPLLQELGMYISQPLDTGGGIRLSLGTGLHATTTDRTQGEAAFRVRESDGFREGRETAIEAGSKASSRHPQPVPQQPLPCPQKGWVSKPNDKSETTEPLCAEAEVQDGRDEGAQGHTAGGRLDGLHRFEGRVLISPSGKEGQAIPEVQMETDTIRISVPTIQLKQCPKSVHQTDEASSITPQETGGALHHLPRRPLGDEADTGSPYVYNTGHPDTAPGSGLQDQLGEEYAHPNTSHPILGPGSELYPDDSSTTGQKAQGYCPVLQSSQQDEQDHSSRSASDNR